jgi:hypothetical protein
MDRRLRILPPKSRQQGGSQDQISQSTQVDHRYLLDRGAARPLRAGAWRGRHHDLLEHYDAINVRYFADRIVAEIGWSQAGPTTRRRRASITFGSYDHRARRIVVHPALDAAHVPAMVVARIVHHEMLHAKHGEQTTASGRRVVHSKAFRAEEATFHGALEADRWIDANLDALLRWRPSSKEP